MNASVRRAVGAAGVGGVLIAVVQSPTGVALTPALGPVLVVCLAALTVLFAATVFTVLALVLVSGLCRNPVRHQNAEETLERIVYLLHRRGRPDLDLTASRPSRPARRQARACR